MMPDSSEQTQTQFSALASVNVPFETDDLEDGEPSVFAQTFSQQHSLPMSNKPNSDPISFVQPRDKSMLELMHAFNNTQTASTSWVFLKKCVSAIFSILSIVGIFSRLFRFVLIDQNEIGVIKENGYYKMLAPGWHYLPELTTQYIDTVVLSNAKTRNTFPTFGIYNVQQGHYGLLTVDNKIQVLTSGLHLICGNRIGECHMVSQSASHNSLGPIHIMNVKQGYVREVFDSGRRILLPFGFYIFSNPYLVVGDEHCVQETFLDFEPIIVNTADGVPLSVEGLLHYKITDPQLVADGIGLAKLQDTLICLTDSAMSDVFKGIRHQKITSTSETLKEIGVSIPGSEPDAKAQRTAIADSSEHSVAVYHAQPHAHPQLSAGEEAVDLRHHLCEQIRDTVRVRTAAFGVEILDVSLKSINFTDQSFAKQIEETALQTSQYRAKRSLADASNSANAAQAQGEIAIKLLLADASLRAAQIEAQVSATQASAEAQRIQILAEAEAERIRKIALVINQYPEAMKLEIAKLAANSRVGANLHTLVQTSGERGVGGGLGFPFNFFQSAVSASPVLSTPALASQASASVATIPVA